MSTQTSSFPAVPFSITQPAQGLRLLELPNELLELLSSDHKPDTLHLKSAPPPPTKTDTQSKDHFLHLCTHDKVWAIRQVSTSNSLYITCPNRDNTTPGVTAISQPTSSLELIPVSAAILDAEKAIRAVLPVYHLPSDDVHPPTSRSKQSIFSLPASIPLPDALLRLAIRNLFVFDLVTPKSKSKSNFNSSSNHNTDSNSDSAAAYIPTPNLLLKSWDLFQSHFLSKSDDPDDPERPRHMLLDATDPDVPTANISETLDSLARSEGVVYASVANAIIDRFADGDTANAVAEEIQLRSHQRRDQGTKGALMTKELTIWIGCLIVRCAASGAATDRISHGVSDGATEGISERSLVDTWQNIIPRQWWGYCDVDALLGYEYESERRVGRETWGGVGSGRRVRREMQSEEGQREGRVYFVATQRTSEGLGGEGFDVDVGGSAKKAATATITATAGKRNWHERFKRERMGGR